MRFSVEEKEKKALEIRNDVINVFEKGRMGHIASSFSSVEIMVDLCKRACRPDTSCRDDRLHSSLHRGIYGIYGSAAGIF